MKDLLYSDNPLVIKRTNSNGVEIDKTFATRLLSVLEHLRCCYGAGDMLVDLEADYLINITSKILEYQRSTITPGEEKQYFDNIDRKQ